MTVIMPQDMLEMFPELKHAHIAIIKARAGEGSVSFDFHIWENDEDMLMLRLRRVSGVFPVSAEEFIKAYLDSIQCDTFIEALEITFSPDEPVKVSITKLMRHESMSVLKMLKEDR